MADDRIADFTAAWKRELPDLDVGPMTTIANVNRLSLLINRRIDDALSAQGRSLADFDVLAALRREGAPYRLKPSELSKRVMLSPSGMTHRVDLLEAAGLVERHLDPTNRRSMPVALTPEGIERAEELVRLVVDVEAGILGALAPAERASLDTATRAVINAIEN